MRMAWAAAAARIAAAFAVMPLWLGAPAHADEATRHVLILHSYNYTSPATSVAAASARDRLQRYPGAKIELDSEYLDVARFSEPGHEQLLANFLRDRYAQRRPDILLLIGGDALPFVLKHRDSFGPHIPVVFVGAAEETLAQLRRPPDVTGHLIDLDQNLRETLRLAERLQPSARRLVLIAGSAPVDRRWQTVARRVIEEYETSFDTTYLFELPYDALAAAVSRLPSDAIVISLSVSRDGAGQPQVPIEVTNKLAALSPAPVYAPSIDQIGRGIVGGFSETFEAMGIAGADIALQVLGGRDISTIPPHPNPNKWFQVDYKALEHWKLSEANLLPGTIILNKPRGIWEQHRDLVLAALLVFAVQTAFLGALLIQRRHRRRVEALLKKSEERMTFTAASTNVGLWQLNSETGELWATEHCRTLLGLAPDAALTRDTFLAAIEPEDRATVLSALRKTSETGGSAVHDVRIPRPDGQARWVRVRVRSDAGDHGASNQLSGVLVDLTEQKAAEAEAALQREEVTHLMRVSVLGELSGAIAHEINQPLTAILSNAQTALHLLKKTSPDIAEIRDALQDIVHEDVRAGEVIQRLRNLLKKGERNFEAIDMNALVMSAVSLLNSELIARRVSLQTELAEGLPAVSGDPVQLQQILLNLMINAMDAMSATPVPERQITVCTTLTHHGVVEVLVKDRGTGIRPEEQARLFEPFFTTKEHGLGLGLAICATILQAHHGKLVLRNDAGGGTVAVITLPAQEMLIAAQ